MKADLCLKYLIGKPEDDKMSRIKRKHVGGGGVTKSDIKRDVQAEQMARCWNFEFIVRSM